MEAGPFSVAAAFGGDFGMLLSFSDALSSALFAPATALLTGTPLLGWACD